MKKKAETKAVHIDTIPNFPAEKFADRVTTEDVTFQVGDNWYRIPFFVLHDIVEELFVAAMRACKDNEPPYTGYASTDAFKRMEDVKEFLDAPYLFEPAQVTSFWKKFLSPTIKQYEAFILY